METSRAALALCALAAGCVDPAQAQPRPDAGVARRWSVRYDPRAEPRGLGHDGGIPAALLGGTAGDGADLRAALAGAAVSEGPRSPATTASAGGDFGRIASPPSAGRYDDPEQLGGVPLADARMQLAVAGGWTHRCLERARHATPFVGRVRVTVARDGAITGIAAEDVDEPARRCLAEGFGHARFHPVPRPTALVARYRYTVRWRATRRVRDAGRPP